MNCKIAIINLFLFSTVSVCSIAKEQISFGFQVSSIKKDRQSIQSGYSLQGIASTYSNQTFFTLPIKTNINAGIISSKLKNSKFTTLSLGIDKELIFKKK